MTKRILPKLWAALMLYLGSLPLFLLPAAALLPGRAWIGALLPVPALLLTGRAGMLPSKRRVKALIVSIAVMAAGCAALFLFTQPAGIALFVPCLFLMLFFMPATAQPAHQEWTMSQLLGGIVLHVLAQFLKNIAVFASVGSAVGWVFLAYLIGCLFAFNRSVVMGSSTATAKPLLSFNRGMLAGFIALSLLLANIRAVGAAIHAALYWVIAAVMQVLVWFSSLFEQAADTASPASEAQDLSGLMEASGPSLFARIMEIVFLVIAALGAAALLLFALRFLFRLLKKLLRRVLARWQAYRQRISADYSDQSESLLDWGDVRKAAKTRLNRFKRRYLPTAWEKLSPAQRVRRIYALLLRKPGDLNPALTAREMLSSGALQLPEADAAALARLYDQARYSDHPVTDTQADDLRRRTGV